MALNTVKLITWGFLEHFQAQFLGGEKKIVLSFDSFLSAFYVLELLIN